MIKRMNKVTSLLVAAAAIVSLVPATGVNAADRLQTKEGTIEAATAFDGGKYLYQGYRSEDDDTAIYFNAGEKDKPLEDLNDAELKTVYGSKYAVLDNSGDEYLVDLSSGKVVNDETREDKMDTLKSKLKSTLSKTDRYGKVASVSNVTLTQITENQFGEVWFEYTATGEEGTFSGYVSDSGKYIDMGVTANIYTLSGDKMVKIDEFNDLNKDKKTYAKVVASTAKTIAQDSDSIYRTVDVNVTTGAAATLAKDAADGKVAGTVVKTYLQKISKAQGEKEKDAFLPKNVTSYEISSDYDSDDAKDAVKTLADADKIRVIKGVVYATTIDNSKKEVTVATLKLKKAKVKLNNTSVVDSKLDVYLVEQDVEESEDMAKEDKVVNTDTTLSSVAIDVDGNTWVINKGEIMKFDGKDFKVVYNCDRSLDTLNVYNEKSLVAWEDGEDVYTTVQEGKVDPVVPAQTGWVNTAAGWTFFDAAGKQVVGSWVNAGGVWYMMKADGIMATGWYNDNGTWYFLNASGAMQTGWMNANGTWYYLQSSGAMKTGWLNDNGTWYFLNANGSMAANTSVNGYALGANGAWIR